MSVFFRSVLTVFTGLVFVISSGAVSSASAEVFYWRDVDTRVSVSFPDTWRVIHNQKPDDVFTVVAPSDGAMPMCRLRVREDRRFVIYPARFADNIQRVHFSRDFWEQYAGEYQAATLQDVHDDAGLGRGFGSYAHIAFISEAGPRMQRRGVAFAALYNDKAYILECSSEASAFEQWYRPFLSIAKSVDFRKEVHELPGGHYRHFPVDGKVRINGQHPKDVIYY